MGWLRLFAGFLLKQGYHKQKCTDGIESLGKRSRKKQREYIPPKVVKKQYGKG
ncbi:MAG: hypothetical protein FWF54_02825 [Candidatus Azobacteroides sp.]|nr:hypothetical protein [Candidatus Azobacteroides sp.]